jgi:type IV pilus assembly protein PilE
MRYAYRGFTLIELLVAVAIIGLLAAIAMPAYQNYVRRGEIPEATNTLANWRVQMEQYYQDNKSYSNPPGGAVCGVANPAGRYFAFTCALGTGAGAVDQSYTLTATGNPGLTTGFVYTLNQQNTQVTVSTGVWARASATSWLMK